MVKFVEPAIGRAQSRSTFGPCQLSAQERTSRLFPRPVERPRIDRSLSTTFPQVLCVNKLKRIDESLRTDRP